MKAIVVGAGINGLATAWALCRRGWDVELTERGPLPNPEAASYDHHRLIRTHYAGFPVYAARIAEAFDAWRMLATDTGVEGYVERGMLALSRSDGDWAARALAAMVEAGVPHRVLEPAEVNRRFPVFETGGVRFGAFTRDGGALLADRILEGLVAWLGTAGATLHASRPVTRIDAARGIAETPQGPLSGDVIVVAAGVGLPALAPQVAAGCHPRRAVVVYLDPPPALRADWERAPCWVDLGGEDDLWGMPPMCGLPMKIGYGLHTVPGDPETGREAQPEDAGAILAAYRGRFCRHDEFTIRRTVANFYLMAPEERFILSRDDRAVWLSADSGHGFKFGALTGLDVAEALDGGDFAASARRLAGHDG